MLCCINSTDFAGRLSSDVEIGGLACKRDHVSQSYLTSFNRKVRVKADEAKATTDAALMALAQDIPIDLTLTLMTSLNVRLQLGHTIVRLRWAASEIDPILDEPQLWASSVSPKIKKQI
jgi:hypothetical protein